MSDIRKLKGYEKLTDYQKDIFNGTYKRHQYSLGESAKVEYTPVSVKAIAPGILKVVFKNKNWLHYTSSLTWY